MRLETRVVVDLARARARARTHGTSPLRPIVLNALPKSGTHLLVKAVSSLPDVTRVRLQLSAMTAARFAPTAGERVLEAGVESPVLLSFRRVEDALAGVPPGAFVTAHMPWSYEFRDLIAELDIRMLLMIRDPRDVAVSSAEYIGSKPSHPLWHHFRDLSRSELLMASIEGRPPRDGLPRLLDLRERVFRMLAWREEPFVRMSRFEDLVGSPGGGSDEFQRAEIMAIAEHVGASCSPGLAAEIGNHLFGGTGTFRKGRIGAWRTAFDDEHLRAASAQVGDLLKTLGYETPQDRSSIASDD